MTELLSRLFVKNHKNVTEPRVRTAYGVMVSITGIVVNLLLFLAKFTVGTLFGAISIVADAVNNLSDAGTQIISLISFRISSKPADREHPFGHARIEYVASMIVSFLVLLVGVELLKSSIQQIFSPERPESSPIAIAVLIGSILFKLWLALFNRTIGKRINSSVMRATAADSLSDVLSTSAVLVASVIPLFFQDISWNPDAYMGVIVAVLILVAGIRILNDAKNSILGEAPSDEIVQTIADTIAKYPAALGIHDMIVHNYGPGHIIASLHVEVDGKVDVFETHDIIDTIEKELRTDCGIEATIHMDPIVTDDAQINHLRQKALQAVKNVDEALQIHDFRFVCGKSHSNLIFDVVVPFEVKLTDEEIKRAVATEISRIDPNYFTVLTIDRC
ncbi:MAG: cation transporter [Clostridia bacterium]|nr:cation transporter [Clostridia bacterium]